MADVAKRRRKRLQRFKPGVFKTLGKSIKVERARAPTRNELLDLLVDLVKHAAAFDLLKRAAALPPELRTADLPLEPFAAALPELFFKLRNLIMWDAAQIPWTQEHKNRLRSDLVTYYLDHGAKYGSATFDGISRYLVNTPFFANADMIEKSYKRIEKRKSADQRRKRRGNFPAG